MDTDRTAEIDPADEAVTYEPAEAGDTVPEAPSAVGRDADDDSSPPADEAAADEAEPLIVSEEALGSLDPATEAADEPDAPDATAEQPDEDNGAWQLTLPDVDPSEGVPDAVPLGEVAEPGEAVEAAVDAESAEAQPTPDDEHLFELPVADAEALSAIEASISEIPSAEGAASGLSKSPVPWWPYLTYLGLWLVLGIAMVVLSNRLGDPYLPESGAYPPLLLGGLLLAVCGPFIGVAGWGIARKSLAEEHRSGLLSAALLRAAAFTLGGVALWWAALVLVDALRLGWI